MEETPDDSSSLDRLKDLLRAFQQAMREVEGLPFLVWLRRHESPLGVTVPACRPLVRYFVLGHVAKSLRALRRQYFMRAAIADDADREAAERQRLDYALEGLVPIASRRVVLGFVAAAAAVSLVFSGTYVAALAIVNLLFSTSIQVSRLTASLRDIWLSLLPSPDLGKLATAVAALDGNPAVGLDDLLHLYGAAILTGLAAYVPLSLTVGSFRLKRLLFTTYPEMHGAPRTPISSCMYASRGIYELEGQGFAAVGGRPPREIPLDLIRQSVFPAAVILWSLPLAIPSSLWPDLVNGVEEAAWRTPLSSLLGWSRTDFRMAVLVSLGLWAIQLAVLLLVLPLTRLVWLLWVHRVRSARMPSAVPQAHRAMAVRLHRFAAVAISSGVAASLLGPFLGLGIVLGLLAVWSARAVRGSGEDWASPGARFMASAGRVLGWFGIAFSGLALLTPALILSLRQG